jgi:hypothetical protein
LEEWIHRASQFTVQAVPRNATDSAHPPAAPASAWSDRYVIAELERNESDGLQQTLVGRRWKLLRSNVRKTLEVFDLESDPVEGLDLASTEPGRARDLEAALDSILKALPPRLAHLQTRRITKEAEVLLKGQGYIH